MISGCAAGFEASQNPECGNLVATYAAGDYVKVELTDEVTRGSPVDFTQNDAIRLSLWLAGITVDLEPVEEGHCDPGVELRTGATS